MQEVAPPHSTGTVSELLERSEALSTLGDSLGEVQRSSRGQVVLVGGEAGVGKTALLRRFSEQRPRPARTLWGACDPLFTPRPLGPLLAIAEDTGGELEQVLGGGGTPHEVVGALRGELRARGPTVFVLEDLHWADEATLDVVRLLARRVETVPALVVATYRDEELDRHHPLRLLLGELATSVAVKRLKLAPLSPAGVAVLAEPYGVDADELHRKTAGNPFFVLEALAAGGQAVPDTIRDAVLARSARLGAEARTLLEAVAIVPQEAELWLLEALAPEAVGSLDECLTAGMLASRPRGVGFRHELARLAVEESVAPDRKVALHRRALAALTEPPGTAPDLARLAHHADAAGDADAVLRYAPAAGERAASLGAHREAAAQYARALRFGDRFTEAERAKLLEARSRACYLTDQNDAAIEAIEEALEYRRRLGQKLEEGDALRWLSQILWCPGRPTEAARAAHQAVELLEQLPPARELAMAYANLAETYLSEPRPEAAVSLARRALELARRRGEPEIEVRALTVIGTCELGTKGPGVLEQALALTQQTGLHEEAGRAYLRLVGGALYSRRHDLVTRYLQDGLDYCGERGLERDRFYLLAFRARFELAQGRWTEAADSATAVLRLSRSSIPPRVIALVVLGLVRARRGDPGQHEALEEAWALAEPTGELTQMGFVAAARAEAAWLEGDRDAVDEATTHTLQLAQERGSRLLAGELANWRRRSGLDFELVETGGPFRLQLAGEWAQAAERWRELGCPYETAIALAEGDEAALREAHEDLLRLEAQPAAAIVAGLLRERGARGLPRGPRPATRENPASLTPRELEVLGLVAEGLRDGEIADRLVLSKRTVGHHVSAILRKLGVRTRAEASVEAVRLGVDGDDR